MTNTQSELSTALFFLSAMCLAGLVHVWWLRSPLSQRWRQPIDGGKSLRRRRVFGNNKAVRGFMVLPLAAALCFPLLYSVWDNLIWANNANSVSMPLVSSDVSQLSALGFASGFGFMFGELPNSFIKRQLDIAPGLAPASPVLFIVFAIIDRVDSTLGALLFASLVVPLSALTCVWVCLLGFVLHTLFSTVLHKAGVKNRAL